MADIFVSYTSQDREWAFWIGKELLRLGHAPHVHEWEISGGGDIEAWMEERHDNAEHILCVVSDAYLKAPHSSRERRSAQWAIDRPNFALPVFVEDCKARSLFANIKRCDLHGLSEHDARLRLEAFLTPAAMPAGSMIFPGVNKAKSTSIGTIASGPASFPGRAYALSNIPITVPRHFLGRDSDLAAIDAALRQGDGRAAVTALHGLRGVGKTTLAAAYAERHRADYSVTWWIKAETDTTMRADLVGLGVQLGWVAVDASEERAMETVLGRLRAGAEEILLIYDNAIGPKELARFLPRGVGPRIIVTSNAPNWGAVAAPVEIEVWPRDVGADFLVARVGRQAERNVALELSEALGGLPLAHEQAAAYCERLGMPLSNYATKFADEPGKYLDDVGNAPEQYHNGLTVSKTFALAIDEAVKRHKAAEALIAYAALLAPEPIPLFLFAEGRHKFSEPFASALAGDGLDEAIGALRAFALVDREPIPDERDPSIITDTIRLHRLVRDVAALVRDAAAMGQGTWRSQVRQELLQCLSAVYPADVLRDPDTWARARRLDAIAVDLTSEDSFLGEGAKSAQIYVMRQLAKYRVKVLADYGSARSILCRALVIGKSLGPEHPSVAAILNTFAGLLEAEGNLREACVHCEQALAIRERVLGLDHPDTAETLTDLGYLSQELEDLPKAQLSLDRALAIHEKIETLHPNTAMNLANTAMNLDNLGFLMQRKENFKEARLYHERALAIRERSLKPGHPNIAISLNNLGSALDGLRDLAGARKCYEEALAIQEKTFGFDHPDTATTVNNIGHLLHMHGEFSGARQYYERSLATREKLLGLEHPDTATSLSNIGVLLDVQGNFAEAKPYFERALLIYQKSDSSSPDTAETLYNLGSLQNAQGKFSEARLSYERSLGIYEKVLGSTDSETVSVAEEFAAVLVSLELPTEAAAIRRKFGIENED